MTDLSFFADKTEAPQGAAETKAKASAAPTRKDVVDILNRLDPVETAAPTAAEKERASRVAKLEKSVVAFGSTLKDLGLLDARDTVKAAAAAKALEAMLKNARAAIESIPDGRLVETPKPAAKQRATATRTLGEADAAAAVARAAEPEPEAAEPEETAEEVDARIKRERAERDVQPVVAQPQTHRSGPASAGPRGEVDPNANDGF